MNICFIVGSLDISGGTYVILQHASYLEKCGHNVSLLPLFPYDLSSLNWHPALHQLDIRSFEECESEVFDLAIFTWWKSCFELQKIQAERYAYFVQSIESKFYDETDIQLQYLAESTYLLPLPTITEATWIQTYLRERYGRTVELAHNGIRKDIYHPEISPYAERESNRLRVLVEGPLGVPFKNVEKTLELAKKSNADEIWLLTSSAVSQYAGIDRVFSQVPIDEAARVYRSCDVIVKLSYVEGMFGPPLEMFHCGGTAITYDVSGHDEYIEHNKNAIVVQRDDEVSVVNAINTLKSSPEKLYELKSNALETARKWPDWSDSSQVFVEKIEQICEMPAADKDVLGKTASALAEYATFFDVGLKDVMISKFRALLREKVKQRFPRFFSFMKSIVQRIKAKF